jgi:hypothetical protein
MAPVGTGTVQYFYSLGHSSFFFALFPAFFHAFLTSKFVFQILKIMFKEAMMPCETITNKGLLC